MDNLNEKTFSEMIREIINKPFLSRGRIKLPRKKKKLVYLTRELRKKHIPEYYKK